MTLKRLLIVDDDADMSQMLAQHLGNQGFIVFTASNEQQIREAINRGRIDLILLDVMLGEENGLEICRQLRSEQDVAIILVSALSADSHRISGYAVGADDYIAKPFNPDLLVARGVPFRDAHHKVGAAVAAAEELGCVLADLPAEVRAEHLPELDGLDLSAELSVDSILERRAALGGTAPSRVRAEVDRWKTVLQSWTA